MTKTKDESLPEEETNRQDDPADVPAPGAPGAAPPPGEGAASDEEGPPPEEEGGKVLVDSEELADLSKRAEERDLYLNELLRARADLDNYQKRVRKDRGAWEQQAIHQVLRKLLAVMDDFDRAVDAMEHENATLESLGHGVKLTRQTLSKILSEDGVEEIPALGETFDPTVHEAVAEEEVTDRPTGEVVAVLQKGYRRSGAVLRPSKVKVARNVASE